VIHDNYKAIYSEVLQLIRSILNIEREELWVVNSREEVIAGADIFDEQDREELLRFLITPEQKEAERALWIHKKHTRNENALYLLHALAGAVAAFLGKVPKLGRFTPTEMYELQNFIWRLTIPSYLKSVYEKEPSTIFTREFHDYGRLIRELTRWSTQTIEGRKIVTGIILVDSVAVLQEALEAVKEPEFQCQVVELAKGSDLFEFDQMKSLLEVADGRTSFIVVTVDQGKLTASALLIQNKELLVNLLLDTNKYFRAPVFSLHGSGLRVGQGNQLLMEFLHGRPRIRSYEELAVKLRRHLNRKESGQFRCVNGRVTEAQSRQLANLLLEIGEYGKGAGLVFGFNTDNDSHVAGLERAQWIDPTPLPLLYNRQKKNRKHGRADFLGLKILESMTKTDGSVLIDRNLNVVAFGAVLRASDQIANEKIEGGARHKSMASFTAGKPDLMGIVISSDGPISIIVDNVRKYKF